MDIKELLALTVKNNASDIHILPDVVPTIRIDGNLQALGSFDKLTKEQVEELIFQVLLPEQKELLLANKELDLAIEFGGGIMGGLGRFRVNAYYQRGKLCAAFRFLPVTIKTIEELKMPKILHTFATFKQGFILVCGPTGHGKSTTIASVVNEINLTRSAHILTIEDPIEYVYPLGKSIVSQREMGIDSHAWSKALRSALREDPDIVVIGEMRDPETISSAITIAETGHLVFSTLHTNSASQTVDRIIDSFPSGQQAQIRIQLASTLKGIISQRLLPRIEGGRIPAVEILLTNSAIASNIREGKTHLIDSVIQTSQDVGMITLESSLASLVLSGAISLETARGYALRPEELLRMIKMV